MMYGPINIRLVLTVLTRLGQSTCQGKFPSVCLHNIRKKNVLPQLVERKQYQTFHHPLPEVPKTSVTYPIGCSLKL